MNKRTIATVSVAYIMLSSTTGCILLGYDYDDFKSRLSNNGSDGALADSTNNLDSNIDTVQEIDSGIDATINDAIQSEPIIEAYICNPTNCTKPEHGTAICTANQCDVQCLVGCTKNGLLCNCPKPECCNDPNHYYDNPQCDGKQSGKCINGICQNDGFEADAYSCIAYCTTCKDKEFDKIEIGVYGPPQIIYCKCKE